MTPRPVADFRSDTVTRPTPEMRRAIADAVVDDDVLGHDPTTEALESEAARILGKEGALFVPSGVMANLIALSTHCRPGDEAIVEEWSHTSRFETGGAGAVAHVALRTLRSSRGLMDADEVVRWITPGSEHTPRTALLVIEQTHNFHGGAVLPLAGIRGLSDAARSRGVAVHMDGARLWNACAASGVSPAEFASHADTVSCCLSKGLGGPAGSLLAGPREFLNRARFVRKRLGGGMRQSGFLAAAGLVALRTMRERLVEDHALASRIARDVAAIGREFAVDPALVQSNIVFVGTGSLDPAALVEEGLRRGILLYATGARQIRIVTHFDVGPEHADRLVELLRDAVR